MTLEYVATDVLSPPEHPARCHGQSEAPSGVVDCGMGNSCSNFGNEIRNNFLQIIKLGAQFFKEK